MKAYSKSLDTERREFLLTATSLLGLGLCLPAVLSVLQGCSSESKQPTEPGGTIELDLSTVPELQQVGGAVKKRFGERNGGRPVLIIRLSPTEFVVLSTVCTHQGVEVNLPEGNVIRCPAHGSRFATDSGRVLQGPAMQPLQRFPSQYDPARNVLRITF